MDKKKKRRITQTSSKAKTLLLNEQFIMNNEKLQKNSISTSKY